MLHDYLHDKLAADRRKRWQRAAEQRALAAQMLAAQRRPRRWLRFNILRRRWSIRRLSAAWNRAER
jgi:hypothetical protein